MSDKLQITLATNLPPELDGAVRIDPAYAAAEMRWAEATVALTDLLEQRGNLDKPLSDAIRDASNALSDLAVAAMNVRMGQVVGTLQNAMAEREAQWQAWAASVATTREVPPVNVSIALPDSLRVTLEQPPRSFEIEKADGEVVQVRET